MRESIKTKTKIKNVLLNFTTPIITTFKVALHLPRTQENIKTVLDLLTQVS